MTHLWILDVLADLKAYASKNDLPALAGRLDETRRLAELEIGAVAGAPSLLCIDGGAERRALNDRQAGGAY